MALPSTSEIETLEEQYWDELTPEERALERELEKLQGTGSLARPQVEDVAKWKMSTQGGRAGRTIVALRNVTDNDIEVATGAAIAVSNLRTQIDILRALPGIGVGVATSILGFVLPETHVVVDYNIYNGVFGENRDSVTAPRAVELTERLREEYGDSGHTLRVLDRALFVAFGGFED